AFGAPGTNFFSADVSSLVAGVHQLGFRAKDFSLHWSDINWLPVDVPGAPTILLNGHFYSNNVVVTTNGTSFQVTLQSRFADATIFYSTDGTEPADEYLGPFPVTAPFSIRAFAYNNADGQQSVESDRVVSLEAITGGGGNVALRIEPPNGVSPVTSSAAPQPGWSFIGWTGDVTGTNATNVLVMTGPKSARATFGTGLTTPGN